MSSSSTLTTTSKTSTSSVSTSTESTTTVTTTTVSTTTLSSTSETSTTTSVSSTTRSSTTTASSTSFSSTTTLSITSSSTLSSTTVTRTSTTVTTSTSISSTTLSSTTASSTTTKSTTSVTSSSTVTTTTVTSSTSSTVTTTSGTSTTQTTSYLPCKPGCEGATYYGCDDHLLAGQSCQPMKISNSPCISGLREVAPELKCPNLNLDDRIPAFIPAIPHEDTPMVECRVCGFMDAVEDSNPVHGFFTGYLVSFGPNQLQGELNEDLRPHRRLQRVLRERRPREDRPGGGERAQVG
ncbi:unnamed protein product [Prorocentrum cordatum]|uniref:Uncharacterized protein n=1 Tax=Prorocentrum cordatum TaxID=2364126 RepID=A0ABN9XVY8_9DINO|nr:unnamed protein product [Polarella glacialis]